MRAKLEAVAGFDGFSSHAQNFAQFEDGRSVQFFVAEGAVEAIEVWYPGTSADQVTLNGVALFGLDREAVAWEPRLADISFTWDGGGWVSRAHSIGLTDEGAGVVAVLVAVDGYYDFLDEL
jgi:hypothetical protein